MAADIPQFTRDDLIRFSRSYRGKVTYDSIQAITSETQDALIHMPPKIRRNVKSVSRSIGYEFSNFPTLVSSTTEAFITYDRELSTRCRILGLTHVLEEGKIPHKIDNAFMYGVFLYTLSTPKANELLTTYSKDMNGQRVYAELKKHYTGQHSIILKHRIQSLVSSLQSTVPEAYSSHILADLLSGWLSQFDELNMISKGTRYRSGINSLLVDSANKSRIIQDRQALVQELMHIQSTWTEHGYDYSDINATKFTSDDTDDEEYHLEYLRSLSGYSHNAKEGMAILDTRRAITMGHILRGSQGNHSWFACRFPSPPSQNTCPCATQIT